MIVILFLFLKYFGKNYDVLYDCLIDFVVKVGVQFGFVIVFEGLLIVQKFDKEGCEMLFDVFCEVVEFWVECKVVFCVFYLFV